MIAPLTPHERPVTLPTQPQGAPKRIIWLSDGPWVASTPVERTRSICKATGVEYEHDVDVVSCKAIRRATPDEVMEWRIRT